MSQGKQVEVTPAALMAAMRYFSSGDDEYLKNMIVASTPGGIEAQEAQGQIELSKADKLPFQISGGMSFPNCRDAECMVGFKWGSDHEYVLDDEGNRIPCESCAGTYTSKKTWAYLESLGFKFGDVIDDLFIEAEFPDGWTKERTDHHMWTNIKDGRGRVRMKMFYKAAFYDQKAHVHLYGRFRVSKDYDALDNRGLVTYRVWDESKQDYVFQSTPIELKEGDDSWKYDDQSNQQCCDWLNENYPENGDPSAHWDED